VWIGRCDRGPSGGPRSNPRALAVTAAAAIVVCGLLDDWELREWALAHRLIPEPPARYWYERTPVRGTLAGGGLIGLCWTSYQIAKTLWPRFFS
jgi:hypothetical protein